MPYDNYKHSLESRRRLYYSAVNLTFRKSDPAVYSALKYAVKRKKTSVVDYCRQATINQLENDNYLCKNDNGEYCQVIRDENDKPLIVDI